MHVQQLSISDICILKKSAECVTSLQPQCNRTETVRTHCPHSEGPGSNVIKEILKSNYRAGTTWKGLPIYLIVIFSNDILNLSDYM